MQLFNQLVALESLHQDILHLNILYVQTLLPL